MVNLDITWLELSMLCISRTIRLRAGGAHSILLPQAIGGNVALIQTLE